MLKTYQPGDNVPVTGGWICSCGIGHYKDENYCVSCGKDKEGELNIKASQKIETTKPMFPFLRLTHRSLFRRVSTTGAIAIAE